MEVFFESNLRFWPQGATVTQLAASSSWPPCFAAVGYAPCLRAWKPEGEATAAQFSPVHSLLEVDGSNFVACCIQDGRLAAAESSGRIGIWNTTTWNRVHTLSAGAEITALALSNAHVAVGTACGAVMAWQCEAGSEECKQVFVARQVDTVPIRTVLLNHTKYAEGRLLVVHSAGRNSVNVWHLTERRLMHRLVRKTAPSDASAVVSANMHFAFLDAVLFAGVSWCEGHDPMIQLAHVVEADMQDMGASERLSGRGRPLAADFAGGLLAVGFEDGALAVFGRYGWLRWHGGSVGAVKVLPHRTQVVSGGADKQLCLWSGEGTLLACVDVSFQITALACSDCAVVVGGAQGEMQIAVLEAASEEQVQKVKAQEQQPERSAQPQHCTQYDLLFDYRTSLLKTQDSGTVKHGHVSSHPDVLAHYVRPRTPITAEHLAAHAAAKDGDPGAKPEPTEEQKEAAKRKSLQQMGEASSVARNAAAALPSSVDKLGEKCANPSCLTRSGAKGGQFMRCGSCKERRYCSQHCQRTHWRDGHSKECAELVRRRLERQRLSDDSNASKAQRPGDQEAGTNSNCGPEGIATSQASAAHYHRQAGPPPTAHPQGSLQRSTAQVQQQESGGPGVQGSCASEMEAHQHTAGTVPGSDLKGCSTGMQGRDMREECSTRRQGRNAREGCGTAMQGVFSACRGCKGMEHRHARANG